MRFADFLEESGFAPSGGRAGRFDRRHLAALFMSAAWAAVLGMVLWASGMQPRILVMRLIAGANLFVLTARLANYRFLQGGVNLAEQLPCHLCGMNVFLCAAGLFFDSAPLIDAAVGLSPLPALAALLFPETAAAKYPRLDKFRSVEYFFSHTNLIVLPVYAVAFLGYRPSLSYFPQFAGVLALMTLTAHAVNRRVGSNYMYIARGPSGTPLASFDARISSRFLYGSFVLALLCVSWLLSHIIYALFA